jgi:hypothetical protein
VKWADDDGTRTAELGAEATPERALLADSLGRELTAALGGKDPGILRALWLRYVQERPWSEVAEGTGISPRALEARVRRALPRLRAKVHAHGLGSLRKSYEPRSRRARSRTQDPERRSFANHPRLVRPAFPTQNLNTAGPGFPLVQRQEAA